MMNKVSERCALDKYAKFYYASNRLFFELKIIRILLYLLAIIPVVITVLPQIKTNQISDVICTIISFAITLINESTSSFVNKHKDYAIYSLQLYETGITGSTFSKIEYDRELTNDLNELAIRRGIPKMRQQEKYHTVCVPKDITDDYSYLYICRINAATNKYLLSRVVYIYLFILIAIVAIFVGAIFLKKETSQYLILIIGFYPLISPIIKDLNSAKECSRDCTKVCADIDNYFADGDASIERLARMHYYVQQIEFEMFSSRPTIYKLFKKLFNNGVEVLQDGVTERFKSAIVELKQKSLINKGLLSQPKGKALITQKEYDLEQLKKIEKQKKVVKVTKAIESKAISTKSSHPQLALKNLKSQSNQEEASKKKLVSSKKTPVKSVKPEPKPIQSTNVVKKPAPKSIKKSSK
ncbi:MAG: S-4TM family putative pore-forming effector [Roseburia sp.]|nr:S-4TM family putative pore-forming effector [Anaeroplasma bactoclasticum]MCM1195690.1 S-4TM family putative pore-forming effector [Roseburia sp.]MCM1556356.1 S-4TM family putative pore-forming effector [Anaeroplasma bactoclasticum]